MAYYWIEMATYAIGDIQGCYTTLIRLLEQISFDERRDRIWLVGDLVNRGEGSLQVLRWAKALGSRLITVLGNHDLHLLALAEGLRVRKSRDTLDEILAAPDRDDLLEWLGSRPMIYREDPFLLVHAGLLPQWSPDEARELAGEVEDALRSPRRRRLLEVLYGGDGLASWNEQQTGDDRWKSVASVLTRLRTITNDGRPCPKYSGPPELAPPQCLPWFDIPWRSSRSATIICGHWAALGLRIQPGLIALDTGCVWGGHLTAIRLEDETVFQVPSAESS